MKKAARADSMATGPLCHLLMRNFNYISVSWHERDTDYANYENAMLSLNEAG